MKISDYALESSSAKFLKYISPSIISLIEFDLLVGAKELSANLSSLWLHGD